MAKSDPHEIAPESLFHGLRATRAYADLMFAFGFARLGDTDIAERLRTDAGNELDSIPVNREFHRLARSAFECRISEALRGEPHTGTLDDRCPEVIAALRLGKGSLLPYDESDMASWGLIRIVQFSHILEPERRLDPYQRFLRQVAPTRSFWQNHISLSAEWEHQIQTDSSPDAIWQALQPTEAEAVKKWGANWQTAARYTSVERMPALMLTLHTFPLSTVHRVLIGLTNSLPAIANVFTTAPFFSRSHFVAVDSFVLAVVGTKSLPPEVERPERLELLRSIRSPVLKWVEALP